MIVGIKRRDFLTVRLVSEFRCGASCQADKEVRGEKDQILLRTCKGFHDWAKFKMLHVVNAHLLAAYGKFLSFSTLFWLQSTEIRPNVPNGYLP
jgi:hypothetical protein